MEYCQNCGEPVSPEDRFCNHCRADLAVEDENHRRRSGRAGQRQRGGESAGRQRRAESPTDGQQRQQSGVDGRQQADETEADSSGPSGILGRLRSKF